MPTCAVAEFTFDAKSWSKIGKVKPEVARSIIRRARRDKASRVLSHRLAGRLVIAPRQGSLMIAGRRSLQCWSILRGGACRFESRLQRKRSHPVLALSQGQLPRAPRPAPAGFPSSSTGPLAVFLDQEELLRLGQALSIRFSALRYSMNPPCCRVSRSTSIHHLDTTGSPSCKQPFGRRYRSASTIPISARRRSLRSRRWRTREQCPARALPRHRTAELSPLRLGDEGVRGFAGSINQ